MARSAPPSGQLTRPEEITMNRKIALALVLAFTGAVAYADDITIDPVPFTSTLTRAQVMQELQQYRQAGVNPWADDYNQLAQFRSGLSREQVIAEFMLSRELRRRTERRGQRLRATWLAASTPSRVARTSRWRTARQ
jgi:hypothetical protein